MKGSFSNRPNQRVYGVGYNSKPREGYPAKTGRKINKEYDHWRRMLCRSYDAKWLELHPSYIGTRVDEDWHDFQSFAEWYNCNEYKVGCKDLDKDLLCLGNNTYSSEACCFLPDSVNKAIIVRGKTSSWHKRDGCYEGHCNGVYLGRSNSPLEFSDAWLEHKHKHIQQLAKLHKEVLDPRAYIALMEFRVGVLDDEGSVGRVA